MGWVLGSRGKRFDQVAREAERRNAAEDASAQDLRPRGPGQNAALGLGICGGNGKDVAGTERRVAIAEEIGETAGHGHTHQHNDVNRHDAHIKALCLTIDEPIRGDALDRWLEVLLLARGADFLRTKGIVNVVDHDGPVVIHGVQHIFHPAVVLKEWPSKDRRSRIVFITRDIDESVIRDTLRMFTNA